MNEIIKLDNLAKSFPGRETRVLDHLSLQIGQGEFYGLLGPNGAGKTTLISILTGMLRADQGHINIMGKNIRDQRRSILESIGVVPQEYALYPTLTATENLFYFGSLYQTPLKELKLRIIEGLAAVGLSNFKDKRIETYSGGMKRRINLLASILHKPSLLFLDEPTVGVDVQSREAILNLLKDLNANGTTIVYTSHHLNEAQHLCSKIAIMDHGKIIAEGKPADLIANVSGAENLENVFIHLTGTELRDYA